MNSTARTSHHPQQPIDLPGSRLRGQLHKGLSQIALKQGVRVNAVAPGPVWTPLIPSTMPEERVKNFVADTAFERAA